MGNIAVQPGFARAIAGAGPVFIAFLIPHILAGLTALASGAAVIASCKGTRWHVRAGATYFWAIALLVITAAGLTAVRGSRDLPVFVLGVLALALATVGRHARRHPGARPWRYWLGHGPHILAMTGSYTVMWIAFLADNAKFLPLTSQLPAAASMLLPAVIAAPLIAWALSRHRWPDRPQRASGPARPGHHNLPGARQRPSGPWRALTPPSQARSRLEGRRPTSATADNDAGDLASPHRPAWAGPGRGGDAMEPRR
jgi:hypothetical protein